MAISLQKGQKIDLSKEAPGLSRVIMGLGWDVRKKSGGLFGLFGGGGQNFDLDASVLMLNEAGKITSNSDVIYYGNLKSKEGSVQHTGDNLTGEGAGDDEQIIVDLNAIPANKHRLVFVVNIYQAVERKQDFGQVENAFVRMMDAKSNKEIARYDLTDNYSGMYALIMAEIYRHNGVWKMAAIGEGSKAGSLTDLIRQYT
ncbi:TerD family protein [Thioflexithrix psekupsensis]|uniref:Stress protein n=1 Tax=Thioflexithrix psekupsensis TaxID=1570016 RepID=A0A251XCJ7_9GAMM|nr:TerD family protein [Thioflexithrix psekupsensis]OUD16162.1 stress protein [Thioflexithrix psekupsensis]